MKPSTLSLIIGTSLLSALVIGAAIGRDDVPTGIILLVMGVGMLCYALIMRSKGL